MQSKQYSLQSGVKYKLKVRLRPDVAAIKPLYNVEKLNFSNRSKTCTSSILYPNPVLFVAGAEDSLNIGLAQDMDQLMDRYIDITTKPFYYRPWRGKWFWTSESYLMALLEERYKVCLEADWDIWFVVIRKASHKLTFKEPVSDHNYWKRVDRD